MIIGIDEVGRGAWAGPLVMAAVGLDGIQLDGLTDSKKLTKKRRDILATEIKQSTPYIAVASISATDIDRIGLSAAHRHAAVHAVTRILVDHPELIIDQVIIDGTVNFLDHQLLEGSTLRQLAGRVITMKQADLLVPSVSAASIVAKVARDRWMAKQEDTYPGYGFKAHVGYGTAAHRTAIERLGICELHRRSVRPVMELSGRIEHRQSDATDVLDISNTVAASPTSIGNSAEDAAEHYLLQRGYSIVERNWKTKWCEVDIIAKKHDRVYFVEVKYRKKPDQGGGFAAITPKKLRQMRFAANVWLQKYGEQDAALSAISLGGPEFAVDEFIDILLL